MPIKMMQFVVLGSALLMPFFRVDRNLFQKKGGAVGAEKSVWAEKITPHMDVTTNLSPSFRYFKSKLQELAELDAG